MSGVGKDLVDQLKEFTEREAESSPFQGGG